MTSAIILRVMREFIEAKKPLIRELFLYGIIGGSTAALDVILFQVFITLGIPLLISNFISVNIAIGLSFLLNARYNFRKTNNIGKRAIQFFTIGYIGLVLQLVILWLGVDVLKFLEIYVKVIAVIIGAVVQYILNKFLTFKG